MENAKVQWWCPDPELRQMYKKHKTDAGFDIVAAEDMTFHAKLRTQAVIKTRLYVAIPEGYVGIIKSRSGLAVNKQIGTDAGVIDSGYRGEVGVVLRSYNYSEEDSDPVVIKRGDRIAQLVVVPCLLEDEEVQSFADLEPDEYGRGDQGYGSTGTK